MTEETLLVTCWQVLDGILFPLLFVYISFVIRLYFHSYSFKSNYNYY